MKPISNNENYPNWFESVNKELDMVYDLFKIETIARRKREILLFIFCSVAAFYANPIAGIPADKLIEIKALSLSMGIKDAFFILPIVICFSYIYLIVSAKTEASLAGQIRYYQEALRFYRRSNVIPSIRDISYVIDSLPTTFLPSSICIKYIINPYPEKIKISKAEIIVGIIYSSIPFVTIMLIGWRGKQINSDIITVTCFVVFAFMGWVIINSGSRSETTIIESDKI